MKKYTSDKINKSYDTLDKIWNSERAHGIVGYLLVFTFLGSLLLIELKRNGLLPHSISGNIPANHFYAVWYAFNLLLLVEVISLVFNLVKSVSEALGKQFEILSLILLRSSFKEFVHFTEPMVWTNFSDPLKHILSDAGGALVIFVLLAVYYRIQKHKPITRDEQEQNRFVTSKKLLALVLLFVFALIGTITLWNIVNGYGGQDFFPTFYTILVFIDILIVLISLRYSYSYCTLFRNSGFALTTVFIRLALTAPPYANVALGVGAAVFAIGLTFAYNLMMPFISEES